MPCLRGRDPAVDPAPRHNRRALGKAALQNLVPADQPAAVLAQELVDPAHEVALKLILILQTLRLDLGLASRAALPVALPNLVSADVDPLRRKELHDLGEDILDEPI